jgi:homoserine kinase
MTSAAAKRTPSGIFARPESARADSGLAPRIVRAPASSANLGAGFDCAGVALGLWNELELSDGEGVVVEGEGTGELPDDQSNLAVRAYALLANPVGKRFRFVNRIPLERGLGSSTAAIAVGLRAAAPEASAEELLALGLELEPHADNLAAALAGGVTLTWNGSIARVADALPFEPVALVPSNRVGTVASRDALPDSIPHSDAVFSLARAALLGAGTATGRADLFRAALADRVHEPYRGSALLDEVRADLPEGAVGATLSGSGPTVIVWAEDTRACVADLEARYEEHRVLALAVSPIGAHA